MGLDIYFDKSISVKEIEEKTEYKILIENNYENFKRKVKNPNMSEKEYLDFCKLPIDHFYYCYIGIYDKNNEFQLKGHIGYDHDTKTIYSISRFRDGVLDKLVQTFNLRFFDDIQEVIPHEGATPTKEDYEKAYRKCMNYYGYDFNEDGKVFIVDEEEFKEIKRKEDEFNNSMY
jgi:hypothetical protein